MKNKNIFKASLLAGVMAMTSACNNWLDINVSPNNLPDAQVENVIPGAQIGIGFQVGNNLQIVTSLWMQHMAGTGTQTNVFDVYQVGSPDFQTEWNTSYATLLDDLQFIENKALTQRDSIHAGMAQVMKAYTYALTTDIWGDVPFTQALNFKQFPKPKYDDQALIYPQLVSMVDAGIRNLRGRNVVTPAANGDVIYAGNTDRWIRAANSLKLKLWLNMRHKNPAGAKSAIEALVTENRFINANSGNFNVAFATAAQAQNPIYQYQHLTRNNDMVVSSRFLDSMNATNDPRRDWFFTKFNNGFVAYDNGQNFTSPFVGAGTPANAINRSRWGVYIVGNGTLNANGTITGAGQAPMRLMTKSMVNFWLAEAVLTLGVSNAGTATALFQQAIQDNMDDVNSFTGAGASFATAATTYITSRVAAFNAAATTSSKLNVLIRDKWVASAGNAYEAFNDFRRTGFPRLSIARNAQSGVNRIPVRLPYAQSEIQANATNVPEQVYPAGMLKNIWWMP